jgi:hypothetical protein
MTEVYKFIKLGEKIHKTVKTDHLCDFTMQFWRNNYENTLTINIEGLTDERFDLVLNVLLNYFRSSHLTKEQRDKFLEFFDLLGAK